LEFSREMICDKVELDIAFLTAKFSMRMSSEK